MAATLQQRPNSQSAIGESALFLRGSCGPTALLRQAKSLWGESCETIRESWSTNRRKWTEAPNHGRLVGCRGISPIMGRRNVPELKKAAVWGSLGLKEAVK